MSSTRRGHWDLDAVGPKLQANFCGVKVRRCHWHAIVTHRAGEANGNVALLYLPCAAVCSVSKEVPTFSTISRQVAKAQVASTKQPVFSPDERLAQGPASAIMCVRLLRCELIERQHLDVRTPQSPPSSAVVISHVWQMPRAGTCLQQPLHSHI